MAELTDEMIHEGISVDITFGKSKPLFGDLFLICGDRHPKFPPSGKFAFESLAELQFDQVDDYFGVRSLNDEGDDVAVWLYPLVDDEPVDHNPGPFDGIRLAYNVLRNPSHRAEHYLKCVAEFSRFDSGVYYHNRDENLRIPADLPTLRDDIDAIVAHWASEGIEVGSDDALEVD